MTAEEVNNSLSKCQRIVCIPVQVASETLKLLSGCLPLVADIDGRLEASLLTLLVQLLMVCAAPQVGRPQPALREVVSRLMPLLAGGPRGSAFKAALVALPVHQRQKLQVIYCETVISKYQSIVLPVMCHRLASQENWKELNAHRYVSV